MVLAFDRKTCLDKDTSIIDNTPRLSTMLKALTALTAVALMGADLFHPSGAAGVLFFISTDCPISNGYAPEIQRICASYKSKHVSCTLIYEDFDLTPSAATQHASEYGYGAVPAIIDIDRSIAKHAHATVTPEAVLVDSKAVVRYRGRINNLYASFGKPRRVVTENNLIDALDAVLTGRAIAVPETKALGCYIVDPKNLRN
jgi:hypothetical protein